MVNSDIDRPNDANSGKKGGNRSTITAKLHLHRKIVGYLSDGIIH
jgi:hypothetical protein